MSAHSSDASGQTRAMDFCVHEHRQQESALMGASPRTSVDVLPQRLPTDCPQACIEHIKGGSRISPETASDLVFLFVAGAGFEPATSGTIVSDSRYF